MTFFEKRISLIETGVLLRDAVLEELTKQQKLTDNSDSRIQF